MIRDPELPREEALKLENPDVILPSREGQEVLYGWDAPVSLVHERGRNWYILMGIAVLFLVLYGFFTGSWLMSLTIIVFAVTYGLVHKDERYTSNIRVLFTERGVINGNAFYEYTDIVKFSFVYGKDFLMLELELKKKFTTNPAIYLTGREDMEEIRRILSEKSQEVTGATESISHRIFRILKL